MWLVYDMSRVKTYPSKIVISKGIVIRCGLFVT